MPFINIMTEGSESLDAFAKQVSEKLDGADPRTTFWQCSDAFEALVASDFLTVIGHDYLRTMLDTPEHTTGQWQMHQAVLIQHPSFSLNLTWALEPVDLEPTIPSQPAHAMVCALGFRSIVLDMYRLPDVDLDVFEKGALLTFSHQVVLEPRQILELDGAQWVADVRPSSGACVATFTSAPLGTQVWSFDRASRESWAVSASSIEATQIKETLGILRRFKHRDAAATVDRLCVHPNHDIRWEAIKTLGVLDSGLALARLREAQSDAHPHVRASACRTLTRIEAS